MEACAKGFKRLLLELGGSSERGGGLQERAVRFLKGSLECFVARLNTPLAVTDCSPNHSMRDTLNPSVPDMF